MTVFLWTFVVLEGLTLVWRLYVLATSGRVERGAPDIAFDCAFSVCLFVWAVVLLVRGA